MDETLIDNWNNVVSNDDIVYILGDLIFRSEKAASHYIDRLKGIKHLILGNHDHKWIKNCNLQKHFESVSYYLEIKDGERRIALCHYRFRGAGQHGELYIFAFIKMECF